MVKKQENLKPRGQAAMFRLPETFFGFKFGWGTLAEIGFPFYPFFAIFLAFLEDPPQKMKIVKNWLGLRPRDKNRG